MKCGIDGKLAILSKAPSSGNIFGSNLDFYTSYIG